MSQLSQFYINTGSNGVESVQAGTGISVDNTDPKNPVVTNEGVLSVVAGAGVSVDNTDPQNPVVTNNGVRSVVAGVGVSVDNANPQQPILSLSYIENLSVTVGTGGTYSTLANLISALRTVKGGNLYVSFTSNINESYNGELSGFNYVLFTISGKTWTGNQSSCEIVCATAATLNGKLKNCRIRTTSYSIMSLASGTVLTNCEIGSGSTIYSDGGTATLINCYATPSTSIALGMNTGTSSLILNGCNFSSAATTYIQTLSGQPTGTAQIIGTLFANITSENSYLHIQGGAVRAVNISATKGGAWPANTAPVRLNGGSFEASDVGCGGFGAPYAVYAVKGMANISSASNVTQGCNWPAGVANPNGIYFGV